MPCQHEPMTEADVDLSGMVVEVRQRMAAAPGRVWDLLADLPAVAQHSREVVELHWKSPGPPYVGATFQATNQLGDARWTVTGHITCCDRPDLLTWTVSEPTHPSLTCSTMVGSPPRMLREAMQASLLAVAQAV